uniref:Integrator complex subunit 7 n=1 Tax=Petromyzon marinus TaxID=7757 RepID=S4RCB0_PETMA
MALAANRALAGDTVLGEQEMDANSALMELDKGLRSGKIGEQCEAVVRFPGLFEKYPFPILINSAFLKLADVFRVGNNFLRLCVLKVTQQSEKHLDKILNVDEFVKRIFSVIHSNDPVARAITLRMLGSIACIIPERKNAHHSIRESLDSNDNVEVESAVFAATHFSAQSRDFAAGICNKIGEMIQGLATPMELKMKLIPVFEHMHHDAGMASGARQLLQHLAAAYPATAVLAVTLHTSTRLSSSALIDIPKQIELLLQYLQQDPRKVIKRLAIKDLKLLAKKVPHMWSMQEIQVICECALQTPYDSLKIGMLSVLSTLADSIAVTNWFTSKESQRESCPRAFDTLLRLCQECCFHDSLAMAALAATTLTSLLVAAQDSPVLLTLLPEVSSALESLLVSASAEESPDCQAALKSVLKCVVRVCGAVPRLSSTLVQALLWQLQPAQDAARALICQGLAAAAMQSPVLGQAMLGDLVELLEAVGRTPSPAQQQLLVSVATVIFVANQKVSSSEVKAAIREQLGAGASGWTVYRIARQASRMGNHDVAAELYHGLLAEVASEHFYFWLGGLEQLSRGEQCLAAVRDDDPGTALGCLSRALVSYQRGLASLTAASTPQNPLVFQCEYAKLRASSMQAFSQLFCTCNSLKTNPPPAIATALALSAGRDLASCGRISGQMKQCMEEFRGLATRYSDLYQSSFDADPVTLRYIELHQQSCLLIAYVIDALIINQELGSFGGYGQSGMHKAENESERALHAAFDQVLQDVESLHRKHPPVSYQHTACLSRAATSILKVPLSFPRLFFQRLQSTSIKVQQMAIWTHPLPPTDVRVEINNWQL